MITKEQAIQLKHGQIIQHVHATNRDGSPMRFRVNGKIQTWKTRPEEFKIPVKHGLRDCGYITNLTAGQFTVS